MKRLNFYYELRAALLLSAFILTLGTVKAALVANQIGAFESLISVDSSVTGKIEVLTTNKNTFSGSLSYDTKRIAVKGKLIEDANGLASATVVVSGTGSVSKIRLALSVATDGVFACAVFNDATNALLGEGGAEKFLPPTSEQLKALAGSYTVAWSFIDYDPSVNIGHAFATGKIDANGRLTLTGKTAEGVAFTAACSVDKDLTCSFYAMPYKQSGAYFAGSLKFSPRTDGKYHVYGDSNSSFIWKGQADAGHKSGWGPYAMKAWMEPWSYSNRAALWGALGWATEAVIKVSLGPDGRFSRSDGIDYAVPQSAKWDSGFNFISNDYYAQWVTGATRWRLTLNPSTGVFSGGYLTYSTDGNFSKVKILSVNKLTVSGVMIQPDPGSDTKGMGLGAVTATRLDSYNYASSFPAVFTEK